MTTPPMAVCSLCFESNRLEELSRDADGHLTNICLVCRQKELQIILAQVAAILKSGNWVDETARQDNEVTIEVNLQVLPCGHRTTCWCSRCHTCEDV